MLSTALRHPRRAARAPKHVAAWLVWHSMRVSLIDSDDAPAEGHDWSGEGQDAPRPSRRG